MVLCTLSLLIFTSCVRGSKADIEAKQTLRVEQEIALSSMRGMVAVFEDPKLKAKHDVLARMTVGTEQKVICGKVKLAQMNDVIETTMRSVLNFEVSFPNQLLRFSRSETHNMGWIPVLSDTEIGIDEGKLTWYDGQAVNLNWSSGSLFGKPLTIQVDYDGTPVTLEFLIRAKGDPKGKHFCTDVTMLESELDKLAIDKATEN